MKQPISAETALEKAETILTKNFTLTGEVKLFPLALKHLQNAAELAWKAKAQKRKPPVLKEIESLLEKKEKSTTEFVRGKKLILCSQNYDISALEEEKLKELIHNVRRYIGEKNARRN